MSVPIVIAALVLASAFIWWPLHRASRRRHYAVLARRAAATPDAHASQPVLPVPQPELCRHFQTGHFASVDGFLAQGWLARLRAEASAAEVWVERSFVPGHKQGGTVAYEHILSQAPSCLALYRGKALRAWLSTLIGTPVQPTALHDQSSCSLLFYTRPGDHIGWHHDYNFYCGRHFTVLLSLENQGAGQGISATRLQRRRPEGGTDDVAMQPNTLVVFEGVKVLHRATPLGDGERRVLLSMTFATDPHIPPLRGLARRIKDTAFFGLRALWD